jgi:excisionase family DNA binding protein
VAAARASTGAGSSTGEDVLTVIPSSKRPFTEQEDEQIIRWSKQRGKQFGFAELARQLGRHYSQMRRRYAYLITQGSAQPTKAHRPWTEEDLKQFRYLVESGCTYEQVAHKLDRTISAICHAAQEHHVLISNIPHGMTAKQVAVFLGTSHHRVCDWIHRGWLPAQNIASSEQKYYWRVMKHVLYDFLRNPRYWMLWTPAAIPDPSVRQWATEMRAGRPQWLTTRAVARRYHVSRLTVNQWLAQGRIPYVVVNKYCYINESDLDGFVPPCMRDK